MMLIGRRGFRVLMLLASLRWVAALGCGAPEAFRSQPDGGPGTSPGVGGNAAGGAGGDTTPSGAAGAAGFDAGLSGAAGLEDAGVSGLAGATGGNGSSAGQGGNLGPDGGTAGVSADGSREMDVAGAQGGAGGVDSGAGEASGSGTAGTSGDASTDVVNYCDRARWIATASINGSSAPQGIDGDLTTRFTTGRPMQAGDYYQVDFTGAPSLTAVTLNNTQTSGSDYAITYDLYSSQNGVSWTNFASGPGAMSSTTISFAKTSTRYIRVQVATPSQNTGLFFSIGEFQVACSD